MAATEIKVQMQQRRDTAAGWTAADPTLLAGELGFETDTNKIKIGDGSTAWSSLSYIPAFAITAYPLATADIADDAITGDKLADDITIAGDLTVNGTTTTINSTTLQVDDKNIELGTVATPSDTTADGGGITLKGATDKTLTWVNSTDCWTFDQALDLTAGTESAPALVFDADVNTGFYHPAADELAISTAGNERLRIDSSGNVGIGTSSPQSELTVRGTTPQITLEPTADTQNCRLQFCTTDGTIQSTIQSGGAEGSAIKFVQSSSESMRINSSGDVGIGTSSPAGLLHLSSAGTTRFYIEGSDGRSEIRANNGNLSFFCNQDANASGLNKTIFYRNGNNESMRINSDGKVGIGTNPAFELDVSGSIRTSNGVLFGTDTAAANRLEDYEEGTWTPTYTASTTDPTVTYDQQQGSYVKIGKLIHCEGRISTDAVSGGSGNLRISGLPFQADNVANARGGIVPSRTAAWGSNVPTSGRVQHNASYVELARMTSTSVSALMTTSDLDDGSNKNDMHFAITYRVKG